MAAFREEDVAGGKDVSGAVKLRQLVSRGTGGQERPKSTPKKSVIINPVEPAKAITPTR